MLQTARKAGDGVDTGFWQSMHMQPGFAADTVTCIYTSDLPYTQTQMRLVMLCCDCVGVL